MPLRFTIEVLGETQIDRTFLRLSENASNLQPLFEKLVKELQDVEKLQFESEGAYGSGGWTPLAISTIESKQRREVDNGVLRATDLLYNSLTGGGAGSVADVSSDYLRYGTTVYYAGIHQAGSPSTHLPQRRVVQLPEGERRNIARAVQEYIVTGEFK
jgi:phage gpG-like protein